MIKIFSTDQTREIDQYTIQYEPISSIDLVERASTRFVQEFCRHYSRQMRVIVFAGRGNNGADALAVARLLSEESYQVEAYLFNPSGVLSDECEENKRRLQEVHSVRFIEIVDDFNAPELTRRDVVVDGLFGSGLTRPLEGGFAAVVDYINQSDAQVVSIDIPSGLFGEDNSENDPEAIIRADMTFSFGFPKLAFLFPENAPYVGKWKVLDIGLHPEVIENTATHWNMVTDNDVAMLVRSRGRFAHKGTFGHALLIAGSKGKIGAALLAARACLRSGAGLLTVHLPQRAEAIMQTAFPEAMIDMDLNQNHFSNFPELAAYSAIGIGPGLGQHMETSIAFERLLRIADKPMVIDADALNILSANREWYTIIPPYSILTPHPKEFDRLVGDSHSDYERLTKARKFAVEYKLIVVLKGAYTAICVPSGDIYFNTSGNSGMATAGSGDVLTGFLLGLLAQGYAPADAARIGVYLHGCAGDLAANFLSEESVIASDIIDMLGKAYKQVK
ncbi:NAD(P)H-hydrate dehydratase [Parabacteroides sp. OttesenSCG-928-G07]|nr:NAD(P)H-hydrate dehydratase [Parabacteroides sp. OttesenSCG-928-G07]